MTDPVTYFTDFPKEIPVAMNGDDLRDGTSDCSCSVCKSRKEDTPAKVETQFESYFYQTLEMKIEKLLPQQYLLFPHVIRAFVFATRSWGTSEASKAWQCMTLLTNGHIKELLHVKNLRSLNFKKG